MEYGEKNNSYFLGLEKQRQIKKSINKLIDENNEKITDQMHILSTIKSYYEKLYTTKYPDEFRYKIRKQASGSGSINL